MITSVLTAVAGGAVSALVKRQRRSQFTTRDFAEAVASALIVSLLVRYYTYLKK